MTAQVHEMPIAQIDVLENKVNILTHQVNGLRLDNQRLIERVIGLEQVIVSLKTRDDRIANIVGRIAQKMDPECASKPVSGYWP